MGSLEDAWVSASLKTAEETSFYWKRFPSNCPVPYLDPQLRNNTPPKGLSLQGRRPCTVRRELAFVWPQWPQGRELVSLWWAAAGGTELLHSVCRDGSVPHRQLILPISRVRWIRDVSGEAGSRLRASACQEDIKTQRFCSSELIGRMAGRFRLFTPI